MKYSIFFSAVECGQTIFAIHTAKILAESGKSVIVIDYSQSIYNHFSLFDELQQDLSPLQDLILERNGFEILLLDSKEGNYDSNPFQKFDLAEYDIIILVGSNIDQRIFEDATHRFIFQNLDHSILIQNHKLLDGLPYNGDGHLETVFCDLIECKMKKKYIGHILPKSCESKIGIPFSERDYRAFLDEKATGIVNLRGWSRLHCNASRNLAKKIMKG